MKLFKKLSITILSLILILTGAILLNGFGSQNQTVKAASGADYKYFYLSDMPASSAEGVNEFDTDWTVLRRGGGLVKETFTKNIVLVNNASVSYKLRGLNAERFTSNIGIDIKDSEATKTATVEIIADGDVVYTSLINSGHKYEKIDLSLSGVNNLTIVTSGATSGARIVFGNPRLFGFNLLGGYTENNALELTNLPHYTSPDLNMTYPSPANQNIDLKIRENNQNKIYLSSFNGATTDNPSKVGWNIEGTGAYYFSTEVQTTGSVQFLIKYLNETGNMAVERLIVGTANGIITTNGTYSFAIPAKADEIILATSGGGTTFVNPILYCNSYAVLSDSNMTKYVSSASYVGDGTIKYNSVATGEISLNYHLEQSNTNAVAKFNKCIFAHAASSVRYDLVGFHLTRFTAYVGIASSAYFDGCDGVDFLLNYYDQSNTITLREIVNITVANNGSPLNYIDVNIPVGTTSIVLEVRARGNNFADHSIWCAPMIFGNRISNPQTEVPKLEHNETTHYRDGLFEENHIYGDYTHNNTTHSRTCTVCGYVQTQNHSYTPKVEVVATCTKNGVTRHSCECGYSYTTETSNPNNHTGSAEFVGTQNIHTRWSCCKVTISSTHSFTNNQTKAPTCTDTGIMTHSCNCGYSYTTTIDALGHNFKNVLSSDENYHWYDCSRCDATNAKEAHTYDNNCDSTCNDCGYERSTSHNFTSKVEVVATCTKNGIIRHSCECGYSYTTETSDPNNHTGSAEFVGTENIHTRWSCCKVTISSTHSFTNDQTKDPNCTDTGIMTHSCECGYSYTTTIDALGHDFKKVLSSDENYHWYDCSRCDATNAKEAHVYDNNCDTTCNTAGCGHTRTTHHNWSSWTKSNETQHSRTCSVCKTQETENHSLGDWITTDETSHYKLCSVCNSRVNEQAHAYDKTTEIEATCTTKGTSRYTCSCGRTYTSQDIPTNANNHTGSEDFGGTESVHTKWSCCGKTISSTHSYTSTQTKAPTCTDTGTTTHSCECGYSYTTPIDALGHDYKEVWSSDENYHWYECSRCGSTTNKESHVYDNNCDSICNVCNHERAVTHVWDTNWSTDENNHWKECSLCHNAKNQNEAHSFTEQIDSEYHWKECSVCNYQKDKNTHGNWQYASIDSTKHSKQCGDCSHTMQENHVIGAWYIGTYANTETQTAGEERRDCQLCSYYETRPLTISNTASLSLANTIGLNMYIDANKYTADANAYIDLTYNHNSTGYTPIYSTERLYLKNLPKVGTIYKISAIFASGQIADKINLKLYDSKQNLVYEKESYSILDYCLEITKNNSNPLSLRNLCQSIINYGMTSIDHFGYKTDLQNPTEYYTETIQGISSEIENLPTTEITEGATNLILNKFSFVALSDTSIRIYFRVYNGESFGNYTPSIQPVSNSNMKVKKGSNSTGYFVEVYGIESANIHKSFTVTITHKDGTSTTITYSALNYLAETYENPNSSTNLKNLCIAIYQYNLCSDAYFKEIGTIT